MKQIGVMLKDGTVKCIGIPESATEREPTSDEKIILELSERAEAYRKALLDISNYAVFDGSGWIPAMKKIAQKALDA